MDKFGIPVLFGTVLQENLCALMRFSNLKNEEKRKVIDGAGTIKSKEEMAEYIRKI